MAEDSANEARIARAWIETVEGERGRIRDKDVYPYLRAWIERVSPHTLLDVGCGQGVAASKIELGGRRYCGVDRSPTLIDRAQQRYSSPEIEFRLGNALALPYADAAFDAVFSVALWHLLEKPREAAAELSRVMRKGGNFLILTAHPETYPTWRDLYAEKTVVGRRCDGTLVLPDGSSIYETLYLDPEEDIVASLRTAGLVVTQRDTIRHFLALAGHKPG